MLEWYGMSPQQQQNSRPGCLSGGILGAPIIDLAASATLPPCEDLLTRHKFYSEDATRELNTTNPALWEDDDEVFTNVFSVKGTEFTNNCSF